MEAIPIVKGEFVLQKFEGKGGWTYVPLPQVKPSEHLPFGWVIVSGRIDDFELVKHKLQPMGNGQLFLSLNATIRKKINKQQGDRVYLKLYADELPAEVPQEVIDCFNDESPLVYQRFRVLPTTQQQFQINWIYAAKTEDKKAERILKLIDQLIET
ncbi:MAG: YdeI/OmpD-associated family protein [Bacteroidota bacterium]